MRNLKILPGFPGPFDGDGVGHGVTMTLIDSRSAIAR
jgi:hypothetical protein